MKEFEQNHDNILVNWSASTSAGRTYLEGERRICRRKSDLGV